MKTEIVKIRIGTKYNEDGTIKPQETENLVEVYALAFNSAPIRILESESQELFTSTPSEPTARITTKAAEILQDDLIRIGIKGKLLTDFEENVRRLMDRIESMEKVGDQYFDEDQIVEELTQRIEAALQNEARGKDIARMVVDHFKGSGHYWSGKR